MGDDHDVAWQLAGHQIIPRASVAMHATVVAPIFALTQGEPRLAAVESSYKDALRELKPDGNLSDPITDAARALQEMLVVAGARGDSLGRLLPREWVRRSGEMYYNPMNLQHPHPEQREKAARNDLTQQPRPQRGLSGFASLAMPLSPLPSLD